MPPRLIRLLMVDDSADDRVLFARLLHNSAGDQIEFCPASNVAEAIELLRAREPFDCLLLDYSLDGSNGPNMLQRLREEFDGLPCACVMLTGITDQRAIVESIKAGAWDYLCKNEVTAADLHHAVERAAQVSRLERDLAQQNAQWAAARAQLHEAELHRAELAGVRKAVATFMHELNSPLTGLINCIEMLLEDTPTPDQRQWLVEMNSACQRMAQVLKQMESLRELQARRGAGPGGPLELKTDS